MRHLILLSAIPGSGKSTWSRQYAREHPNTFIISSDQIRKEVTGDTQNFDHEDEVWATFLKRINDYGKKEECNVIADSTNILNEYRLYYFNSTPAFDKHTLVVFNIPLSICLQQNKMRRKSNIVPEDAMLEMYERFEKPSDEVMDCYDEVIFIGKSYHSDKID